MSIKLDNFYTIENCSKKQQEKILQSCLPDGSQRKTNYNAADRSKLIREYLEPMVRLLLDLRVRNKNDPNIIYAGDHLILHEKDVLREINIICNVLETKWSTDVDAVDEAKFVREVIKKFKSIDFSWLDDYRNNFLSAIKSDRRTRHLYLDNVLIDLDNFVHKEILVLPKDFVYVARLQQYFLCLITLSKIEQKFDLKITPDSYKEGDLNGRRTILNFTLYNNNSEKFHIRIDLNYDNRSWGLIKILDKNSQINDEFKRELTDPSLVSERFDLTEWRTVAVEVANSEGHKIAWGSFADLFKFLADHQ